MMIRFTLSAIPAERSESDPSIISMEIMGRRNKHPETLTATDYAGVQAACKAFARETVESLGWAGARADARHVGPRKPRGWDAARSQTHAHHFAPAAAAVPAVA